MLFLFFFSLFLFPRLLYLHVYVYAVYAAMQAKTMWRWGVEFEVRRVRLNLVSISRDNPLKLISFYDIKNNSLSFMPKSN